MRHKIWVIMLGKLPSFTDDSLTASFIKKSGSISPLDHSLRQEGHAWGAFFLLGEHKCQLHFVSMNQQCFTGNTMKFVF